MLKKEVIDSKIKYVIHNFTCIICSPHGLPNSLLALAKAVFPSPIISMSKRGSGGFCSSKLLTGSRYLHCVILSCRLWTSLSSTSLGGLQSENLTWYLTEVSILVMWLSPIDLQMDTALVDNGVEKLSLKYKKNIILLTKLLYNRCYILYYM